MHSVAASAQQRCNQPRHDDDPWRRVLKVDCKSMFTNASRKEVDKQVKCTEIQDLKLSGFIKISLFGHRRILVVMREIPSAVFFTRYFALKGERAGLRSGDLRERLRGAQHPRGSRGFVSCASTRSSISASIPRIRYTFRYATKPRLREIRMLPNRGSEK